jgi:hypothetical protein
MTMNDRCFVIQPFDKGKFDKRFEDIFKPAIVAAGFDPYRVDRDPAVSIPIETIEAEIKSSAACFVDLTTDNPNVWFELGLAIAHKKPLCLVCSSERSGKYPFDVQHRTIIPYSIDSISDFESLRVSIVEKLTAIKKVAATRTQLGSEPILASKTELDLFELNCIAIIAASVNGFESEVSTWFVKNQMEESGFSRIATQASLYSLTERKLLTRSPKVDDDGDAYDAFSVSDAGWKWVRGNLSQFNLSKKSKSTPKFSRDLDDEIPF